MAAIIASMLSGSTRSFADLAHRLIQHFLATPADVDVCAMRSESDRHFLTKPGPPAGDQDTLALQDSDVEHGQSSFPAADVIAISRLRPGSTNAFVQLIH